MTSYIGLEYDLEQKRKARRLRERRALTSRIKTIVVTALITAAATALLVQPYTVTYERTDPPTPPQIHTQAAYAATTVTTVQTYYVTGYNTVPEQTDATPCIAASGANICGRTDVVACPRALPLGTEVEIDGRRYTCEDRLAPKYDSRIDISCDKNTACPAEVTGVKRVTIY